MIALTDSDVGTLAGRFVTFREPNDLGSSGTTRENYRLKSEPIRRYWPGGSAQVVILADENPAYAQPMTEPYKGPRDTLWEQQQRELDAFQSVEIATLGRVGVLQAEGEREGVHISVASEAALLRFLRTNRPSKRPYVSLLDNGNLRAIWRSASGEQIGLQFKGGPEIQYVLFCHRDGLKPSGGRATAQEIPGLIADCRLTALMRA